MLLTLISRQHDNCYPYFKSKIFHFTYAADHHLFEKQNSILKDEEYQSAFLNLTPHLCEMHPF